MHEINRTAGRIPRNRAPILPAGCDYQGRNETRASSERNAETIWRSGKDQPAEACTELGADDASATWASYRPLVLLVAACGLIVAAVLVALVRGLPF
jgi:hypothetical protein